MNLSLHAAIALSIVPLTSHAISFGQPDNYQNPNVVSLRFVGSDLNAAGSCTGTLIHRDEAKYVFLTAAHCAQPETGGWNARPAASGSVGVSFDEVNLQELFVNADGAIHVTGGVAIPHPRYRYPGQIGNNDTFDQALVIFRADARNSFAQTIKDRWGNIPGALAVATLADAPGYVDALVASTASPRDELRFTAVGFGIQSSKTAQGSGDGNQVKADPYGEYPIRQIATVGFKNLNGQMINVVQNTTQGEDFGYTCGGDSGGPAFYRNSAGQKVVLGVLTTANCRSWGAYSRIDYPNVQDFIGCSRAAGDVSSVEACIRGRFR